MVYEQNLVEATKEIFETMIMIPIDSRPALKEKLNQFNNCVSSMVGLAGEYQGMLAVHAPANVAQGIANAFLELDLNEINEEVKDAMSEFANILAGSIKSILNPQGNNIQLSIPSVIYGDYNMIIFSNAEWIIIPFQIEAGQFFVELQVKKNS